MEVDMKHRGYIGFFILLLFLLPGTHRAANESRPIPAKIKFSSWQDFEKAPDPDANPGELRENKKITGVGLKDTLLLGFYKRVDAGLLKKQCHVHEVNTGKREKSN